MRFPAHAIVPASLDGPPPERMAGRLHRLHAFARGQWRSTIRRFRAITPEQWFGLLFSLLLLGFFLALLLEPGSVGRGGR